MFTRTIRLMEAGIRPMCVRERRARAGASCVFAGLFPPRPSRRPPPRSYVFDGKAPEMKSGEITKRCGRRVGAPSSA